MARQPTILILAFLLVACVGSQTIGASDRASGGIDEQSFIELGGERQYVEIMGTSAENPVLLFLHGGPGWPQTPQLRYYSADLAKDVTLVIWEQRGTGKSFMANPNPMNVTLAQIVADGHELTGILKDRFGKEQIYLAGYSWGSIVAMHLAHKYPSDYRAYIGIAQVISMKRGMAVTQDWLASRARESGDEDALRTLEQLKKPDEDFCEGDLQCFMKQYELVLKFGGAVHNRESETETEVAMAKYDDYKGYDWMKAFEFSAQHLEKGMYAADFENLHALNTRVVFFLGRHDWNVPAVLAEAFMNRLSAPEKEIVWFENSAHNLLEEEAQRFNEEIVRIVTGSAE